MTTQSAPHYVLVTKDGRRLRSGTPQYRTYIAGLDYPVLTDRQLAAICSVLATRKAPADA